MNIIINYYYYYYIIILLHYYIAIIYYYYLYTEATRLIRVPQLNSGDPKDKKYVGIMGSAIWLVGNHMHLSAIKE